MYCKPRISVSTEITSGCVIFIIIWAKPQLSRTRSLARCWAAIRLSHHPEPSGHVLHREVDGLDGEGQHVNSLFFCATQVFSNHSVFHRRSVQSAAFLLLSSDEPMSCWAEDTNVCFDLRCPAFPRGGQVSDEWNRFPGSMTRRVRDSVTLLRGCSAGWMPSAQPGGQLPFAIPPIPQKHCIRQRNTSVQINEPALRNLSYFSFSRTWSRRYGLSNVHGQSNFVYSVSFRNSYNG